MRDPILFELVKNAYTTVGEEMGIAVSHSAYSTMTQQRPRRSRSAEGDGGGGGIFTGKGHLITGPGLLHSAAQRPSLTEIMKDFPPDTMQEGDIFIHNHPYRGGIHSNDVFIFRPIFYKGRLSFFTSATMHVADIGGLTAGGLPATATEMYHEGLVIPPIKFHDAGTPNESLAKIIEANSRTPEMAMGDIRALVAATNVGGTRLMELVGRYGYEELLGITEELLEYAALRTRQEIQRLRPGVYKGSFVIDDDGIEQRPEGHRVAVTVTIEDSTFHADFTGTDRQARGPINCPISEAHCAVAFTLRLFIDPTIPMNEGFWTSFKMTLPVGSLVNPRPPAAVNSRMATVMAMKDAMLKGLSEAYPEKATAFSSNVHVYTMNGLGATSGRVWSFMDAKFGGLGARSTKDGIDGTGDLIYGGGDTGGQSLEPYELNHPVLFQRHQIWEDSGGPGKWRGGLGILREVKILERGQVTARIADRARFPPPGLAGGTPGRGGAWVVNRGTPKEVLLPPKVSNYNLEPGDTVTMLTSGGGGFGPAWERGPQHVLKDVLEHKVSVEGARRDYGVAIDRESFAIDEAETRRLRAAMAARAKAQG